MVHNFATDVRQGFIVNANAGGENVHRGELLGLLLGFIHGSPQPFDDWVADLKDVTEIKQEIDEFIKAVFPTFAEEEEEEVPTSELSVADQKVSATAAATTTTTTTTAVDAEENKSDAPAQ